MRQFLDDDQTDDPSDMAGMELGILAPVETNYSFVIRMVAYAVRDLYV
jgi:hypothetical protein